MTQKRKLLWVLSRYETEVGICREWCEPASAGYWCVSGKAVMLQEGYNVFPTEEKATVAAIQYLSSQISETRKIIRALNERLRKLHGK